MKMKMKIKNHLTDWYVCTNTKNQIWIHPCIDVDFIPSNEVIVWEDEILNLEGWEDEILNLESWEADVLNEVWEDDI